MKSFAAVTLLSVFWAAQALAQGHPVKLAASARFDLNAAASVGALNNGQFVTGGGSSGRQTWLAAAECRL